MREAIDNRRAFRYLMESPSELTLAGAGDNLMTRVPKGPSENTPARPGGSIEQQSALVALSDECEEQLRRIADDAENFETPPFASVLDYRGSPQWRICRTRIGEWSRSAAKSERTYAEGVRQILYDKSAMEKQVKENWPVFDVHIRRLFRAFRKIYDSAGDSPTLPMQRIGRRTIDGRHGLEVDIQNRLERHRDEILRARKAPLAGFYDWRAKQRAVSVRETKTPESQSRKRRGPSVPEGRHEKIAQIASGVRNWRKNLDTLAVELKKNSVDPPKNWAKWKVPCRSWTRGASRRPDLFVKAIEYSIEMAQKTLH